MLLSPAMVPDQSKPSSPQFICPSERSVLGLLCSQRGTGRRHDSILQELGREQD